MDRRRVRAIVRLVSLSTSYSGSPRVATSSPWVPSVTSTKVCIAWVVVESSNQPRGFPGMLGYLRIEVR